MKPLQALRIAASAVDRSTPLERIIATDLRAAFHYADKILKRDFYLYGIKIISAGIEGRIEYVIKQVGPKLEQALAKDTSARKFKVTDVQTLVNYLAEKFDPTKNKSYLPALANKYVKGQFKVEDFEKIFEGLKVFDKFKSKMEVKDFNAFKDMDAFWTAVEPFEGQQTGKEQQRQVKQTETDVYYEDSNLKVIIPKTEAASCTYGSGTKWCTAADSNNMFGEYSRQGPLYILMFKSLGGKPRKFQLHYESNSFMNEKDSPVSKAEIAALSKDAGYTKFLSKLIDQHYGEHLREVKEEAARATPAPAKTTRKKTTSSLLITLIPHR
jgi:hypothetical protein